MTPYEWIVYVTENWLMLTKLKGIHEIRNELTSHGLVYNLRVYQGGKYKTDKSGNGLFEVEVDCAEIAILKCCGCAAWT